MTDLKGKKVLVTGAGGFIGITVVKKLLETEVDRVFAQVKNLRPYYYDDILNSPRVTIIESDLTIPDQPSLVLENCKPDYVIVSNAVSFGAKFIQENPLALINSNTIMNVNLFSACHEHRVSKIVYYGSTTGYPDLEKNLEEEDMFKGDPFEKYFSVGWMKRYSEILLRLYSEKLKSMDCTVLRLTNVYGPYDKYDLNTSHFTPAMIRKFCEGMFPLEVWGTGEDSRDLIYSEDVADITIKSLSLSGFNAINVGSGKNYTVNEVIEKLEQALAVNPEKIYQEDKPTMISKRSVCLTKLKTLLGVDSDNLTSLEKGLDITTNWYNNNKGSIYR